MATNSANTKDASSEQPLSLIDLNSLQTIQFVSPSLNTDNIQSYLAKGYQVESGAVPTGINLTSTPGAPAQDTDYAKAVTDLQALNGQLNNVGNFTPSQQALINSIKQQFEQRKQTADSNMRGQASLTQFGVAADDSPNAHASISAMSGSSWTTFGLLLDHALTLPSAACTNVGLICSKSEDLVLPRPFDGQITKAC